MEHHINNTIQTAPQPQMTGLLKQVTLAVSSQWHAFPSKFDWLVGKGFALEYAPDPQNLDLLPKHLTPYLSTGTLIRHHAYFPGHEIGDENKTRADQAMQLHLQAIEAITGYGEQHVTVHVGLTPGKQLNHCRAVTNLSKLVEYGKKCGITICLENLRFGPTSNPEIMVDWTRKSGAKITMDIGHAVSCDRVTNHELSVLQIIDMFRHNLMEVHLYESETDRHHAPTDMSILGPIVDRLLETNCRWWTIELDSQEDILHTRDLVSQHISCNSSCLCTA